MYINPESGVATQGTRVQALMAQIDKRPQSNVGTQLVQSNPYSQPQAGMIFQNAPQDSRTQDLADLDERTASYANRTNGRVVPNATN